MVQKRNILYSSTGDRKEDQELLEPFNYVYQVPGTDSRPNLGHAFNYWLKVPQDKFDAIQEIVQILHISSLVIDDVQDDAVLRSSIPAAHHLYGVGATINAANYAALIGFEKFIALNHPKTVQVYLEELLVVYRGQGIEICWKDNCMCPSEAEYKNMVVRKTGMFFNATIRFLQLFSNCKEDFTPLIAIISVYYQIRNDYFDLYRKEYKEDNIFAEDITQGYFNFPIIHAIQSHPEDRQVMNILKKRTKDIEMKRYCISLLEKFGSFAYTRTTLEEMDRKAREEIQRLGGNPVLVKYLDDLLDWKE